MIFSIFIVCKGMSEGGDIPLVIVDSEITESLNTGDVASDRENARFYA